MDDKQLLEALRGIVREETSHLATQANVDENDRQLRVVIENHNERLTKLEKKAI